MVSKASDDLPDPLRPVTTVRVLRGITTSMFLRLCWRAPCTVICLSIWAGDFSLASGGSRLLGSWKNEGMKRPFAASVWREGNWFVSQCLEVDVASQGESEEDTLSNLQEALELYFKPPTQHTDSRA